MEFIKFLAAIFGPALIGGFIVAQDPPTWVMVATALAWVFSTIFLFASTVGNLKYALGITKWYVIYFGGAAVLLAVFWLIIVVPVMP